MPVEQHARPYRTLTVAFWAWKGVLLAIAVGSQVGPSYDTSSSLLAPHRDHQRASLLGPGLATRLTSWDAIYFVRAAQRGYLFEQEWAFGYALPTCMALLVRAMTYLGLATGSPEDDLAHLVSLAGVVLAHACHFASVLVLYRLGLRVWADRTWALVAALLHVFSPAGLFLSAPYNESPFSLLSFLGWLLLAESCCCTTTTTNPRPADGQSSSSAVASYYSLSTHALTLLSAASFGLATVFRTNGLLNGLPFALDFLVTLYRLVEDPDPGSTPAHVVRIAVLGLSGLLVAAGSFVPQYVAYGIYCVGGDPADPTPGLASPDDVRPWCLSLVPSIYNFVQRTYWNTGFLRYWTVSNAPLFLLAAPMLFVMAKSGMDIFSQAARIVRDQTAGSGVDGPRLALVVRSMAAVQVLLAGLTFTSYHVQIITRLSSGYPAWYWWAAACLRSPKTRQLGSALVVFSVMYASIQGVLFASFLPPA